MLIETAISLKQKVEVLLVTPRECLYIRLVWGHPSGDKNFDKLCVNMYELAAAHGFSLLIDEALYCCPKKTIFLKSSKEMSYRKNFELQFFATI